MFFLILFSNDIIAQTTPVLVVNKTDCNLHVRAYCTLDDEECETAFLNNSNQVTVAAHSTHLFTDVNPPVTGCEGLFAAIRFNFQGSPNIYALRFEYGGSCPSLLACDEEGLGDIDYEDIEEQCIGEGGRIRGVYHSNPSGGSNCHLVFDYGQ